MGSPPWQSLITLSAKGANEKDREELEHSESDHMPEWAKDDPHSYWEAADEHERANGRLYREVQFALPKELNEGRYGPAGDSAPQLRLKAAGMTERFPFGPASTARNPPCGVLFGASLSIAI